MKNIILTGLMGSGKTSVAKALVLHFPTFVLSEVDFLVEKQEGMSIGNIFSLKGEKYFRDREKEVTELLLKGKNQIISLGGGSLENDFNFNLAQETSILVYLKAEARVLYERIKNSNSRPLLNCDNPLDKLVELLEKREGNYLKADYVIDVNEKSVEEVANEIASRYKYE